MGKDQEKIDSGLIGKGPLRITCDAAGKWTEDGATGIGTTDTSGIYRMKPGDQVIHAISAMGDGSAIIYLPSLQEAAGKFYYINAPTGAAGGDISLYTAEGKAELGTYGDLNTDADNVLLFSDGTQWVPVYNGIT